MKTHPQSPARVPPPTGVAVTNVYNQGPPLADVLTLTFTRLPVGLRFTPPSASLVRVHLSTQLRFHFPSTKVVCDDCVGMKSLVHT